MSCRDRSQKDFRSATTPIVAIPLWPWILHRNPYCGHGMNRLLPEKRSWVLRGKLDDRFHVQFARLHKISWCEMFLPCRIPLNHGVEKKDFIDRGKRNAFHRKTCHFLFLPICEWCDEKIEVFWLVEHFLHKLVYQKSKDQSIFLRIFLNVVLKRIYLSTEKEEMCYFLFLPIWMRMVR